MGGGVGFARAHHHALISLQALAGNAWITLQTVFFSGSKSCRRNSGYPRIIREKKTWPMNGGQNVTPK